MSKTKVITGFKDQNGNLSELVRFSYVHVFEPTAMEEGQTPKYNVSILIPKTAENTINAIKTAIKEALEEGKTQKFGGQLPKSWRNPLRDGDEEKDDETYAGHYFISAKSTRKPGIVDLKGNRLEDEEDFYSGCYGRASINFYPFNTSGNKGVACSLNNLQKVEDGEKLGTAISSAENDFEIEDIDLGF